VKPSDKEPLGDFPRASHQHMPPGNCLRLTTKKLGGVRTGSRSQPQRQAVDDLLLLNDREPGTRNVRNDVSTHRIRRVLSREQGIGSSLPEVNASRTANPLSVSGRNRKLQIAVVLTIDGAILSGTNARKRVRHSVDSQGLGIGEQGMTPAGMSR